MNIHIFDYISLRSRPGRLALVIIFLLGMLATMPPKPAFAATITVNTTADENGAGANCSLREAITAANTDAAFGGCAAGSGADTITVPAGTYQLTIANASGVNEDGNVTGDLDVLSSLTIQGAGSGTTIIEAGTNTSNGIDKVFALNPICATPINVTIDGVTVRFGRNSQPSGAADFSFTGGGIDWCSAGAGGTFTLSNSVVSDNTNVNGYGGGLNVDTVSSPTTVNITNVTFSNNQTLSTTQTANGGAINLFGDSPTINITNSTFTGNHTTNPTSGGGAIYFRPTTVGHLSISGSTFTTNTAPGIGGAIATDSHGAASTISIQNSTFTGNTATNSFGGALKLDGTNLNTTPFSLTHLTITGNTAGISGGAIFVGNSNVNMSQSLIVGNNAPTGKGVHKSVDAATATVTNNWWGCSTGPGAAPCDTATTAGGTLNFNPWYRDALTAGTSPIVTNQSSSLTASFLTNSAGSAVPVADLAQIIGRSVTWTATNGNLSSTQGTVQAAGTATGSFQATAAGTAIISAKVDNDNTSPVSSNVLSLTVNKANTTAAITNGATLSGTPSVTGQPVTVNFSVTGAFGNTPTAPTGNVTVSDGTDSCTGTVSAGTCNLTFKTAGAKTVTATYAGDANFNTSPASASASHTVNKADTTTTITSDTPDPSVTGQTVTFNVTVAPVAPGAAVAPTTITGSVVVSDGGTNTCTAILTAGAGSCTIAFPSVGAYSLTGSYGGDSNFNGSTSSSVSHTVNKADTTTAITSDNPDPSDPGQAVTVKYSVAVTSPGAGTPTGNVTVSDGGSNNCTAAVSDGQCDITFSTPGPYTLTATYAGDSNFNGSTSAGEPHTVNKPPTTTTITSDNPDPSVVGQSVTVKYSVTSLASGTPTGNVTVSDGSLSCTATVADGQCDITFTSAGAKSLTATYDGDSNFQGSTSAAEPHTVNKADTTSTITADTPDPSVIGQTLTVKYSVAPVAPGAGTPTGNVSVSDGPDSCSGTAAAGQCDINFTSAGAKSLTATYAGDSNFNGSTSAAESHQVDKASPSLSTAAGGSVQLGSGVKLTDTAVLSGGYNPILSITFTLNDPSNAVVYTNVVPVSGNGTYTTSGGSNPGGYLPTVAGTYTWHATYSGDTNNNSASDNGQNESETVTGAATTTTITSDTPDPSVVGQSVTVQYSVTSGAGTPTGNVTVSDGTVSCTATVADGQCSLTFTSAGTKSLTATYAGNGTFQGSTSAAEQHQVDPADTTTAITSDSPDPSVQGTAVTVKYTVTVNSPGAGTPTGTVIVSDGVNSCTGLVSDGQCDITLTTIGSRTLTATYAGDSNFNGSTSAGESHTVNPPTVHITVDTSPSGLSITVDGTAYTAPQGFDWMPGSTHTIATTSPQGSGGTQYVFNNWSDNGAISHQVAPTADTTYTATFDTKYRLTTSVNPSNGGSVTPASGNFYLAGSVVNLSATANSGFTFSSWTGNVADPSLASTTITMNQPESVTANFSASTSLLYNGAQIVVLGNSFKPAALLSSPASSCVGGQTIFFSLDRNPTTGTIGSFPLGSATTTASGQATMSAVGTTGWLEGIYTITATFNGTTLCKPSSTDATLTVGGSGDSANGGGWYTLSGSGRINFGFVVMKTVNTCTSNCAYKGQLLLINNGKWRLKGTLSSFVKTGTGKGASSGSGNLYWWDTSLNGGLGDWALAQSGVAFTINFYDSGKTGKQSTDSFAINIQYTPVPPQPGTLPNSNTLTVLKGGDIKVK